MPSALLASMVVFESAAPGKIIKDITFPNRVFFKGATRTQHIYKGHKLFYYINTINNNRTLNQDCFRYGVRRDISSRPELKDFIQRSVFGIRFQRLRNRQDPVSRRDNGH